MIVGTAGHIDHGKTSLVKAITGVDADRLKEEKARGITIDLGFAYWPQPDGSVIGFVDVPGHERFVHTMMAGAQGVDCVMLVIAADDGVMPQTREHLEILALLGHKRGVVALTKADAVDATRLIEVEAEIEAFLDGTPLEGSLIFPVSSHTGQGLGDLTSYLQAEHARIAPMADHRLFRLAVDRSFTLQGAGVVVTGTVLDGRVNLGDEVVLSPSGLNVRVRSIHAQNCPAQTGRAGDRCALNLAGAGLSKDAIARGDMVLAPALHAPTHRIDAALQVAKGAAKGLSQWMPVRLHHATTEVGAHIVLLDDASPKPGDEVNIQLVLEKPIAALALDRFILRDPSASITMGGGHFLDLRAPDRKRRTPERAAILTALGEPDNVSALAALFEATSGAVALDEFARDRGVAREAALGLCVGLGALSFSVGKALFALSNTRVNALATLMRNTLTAFHGANPDMTGTGLERLRLQTAPRIAAPLFRVLLRHFVEAGWLVIDGNWIRLASHSIEMSIEDENLWCEIKPQLSGVDRFRPPRVRDIAQAMGEDEANLRRLLRRTARAASVDEVAQDHFFLRPVVTEMVEIIATIEQDHQGWFSAAMFRDALEQASTGIVGRKVAIQILEFFDRHGVTLRRGDNRRINPHRRDLFAIVQADDAVSKNSDKHIHGRESSLVGRPDFKSGWGCETVPGGFDSHSLPPSSTLAPSSPLQRNAKGAA